MKRKRVAASLATLLFLVGCGSNQDDKELSRTDQAYVNTLREEVTGVKDTDDKKLINMGKVACTVASDGYDFNQTIKVVSKYGYTDSDSAYIVGTAFAAYCPNNVSKIGR
jgi:uncharacterized lipoprotein NlpE involved in copper resistance